MGIRFLAQNKEPMLAVQGGYKAKFAISDWKNNNVIGQRAVNTGNNKGNCLDAAPGPQTCLTHVQAIGKSHTDDQQPMMKIDLRAVQNQMVPTISQTKRCVRREKERTG